MILYLMRYFVVIKNVVGINTTSIGFPVQCLHKKGQIGIVIR